MTGFFGPYLDGDQVPGPRYKKWTAPLIGTATNGRGGRQTAPMDFPC
jgi:hypothetical protein